MRKKDKIGIGYWVGNAFMDRESQGVRNDEVFRR